MQPEFAFYAHGPQTGVCHAIGLMVLTLSDNRLSAMTRFDNAARTASDSHRTLTS
jgi:RNA polymerase sigma-70 factor (ECF subfamily)